MKRIGLFFIFLLTIALVACGGSDETDDKQETETNDDGNASVSLRLGHAVAGEEHPYNLAAKKFAELVNEKTNGEVEITIYPGGQLGGEVDMLEMVQNGTLDSALISASVFSGSTGVLDGLTIPFLFDSYDTYNKALETDVAQEMLDSLDDLNVKGLGFNNAGMRHIGSNVKPIETPDDFSGLKIRVMESPIMLDIFNTLGANSTPMAYGEIYSALQTGVIDAHETNLITFTVENFHEVTEYISLLGVYHTPNVTTVNLDTFDSLSEEHQAAFEEAGKETSLWMVEQMQEIDEKALEELEELDKNINDIDDMQAFIDKVQPVYEKYGEKDPLIQKLIDEVENIKGN